MDKRLYLIDGHALMFRMYYAFLRRPMINTRGVDTSILFGFTKYLLELVKRDKPTHLVVSFDLHAPTFRHQAYPEYKATRDATPEVVRASLDPLIELMQSMHIAVVSREGFEADDVIGTLATRFGGPDCHVWMVTPDKDFGQLVSEYVSQYRPGKGGDEPEILGPAQLCAKYGISKPSQIVDLLAIWGDTADNVLGVKGVGEIGAAKLVAKYGSLENVRANISDLPPRQAEAFREAEDHLDMSKWLVTIKTDVPLDEVSLDSLRWRNESTPRTMEIISEYQMPSLKALVPKLEGTLAPALDFISGEPDLFSQEPQAAANADAAPASSAVETDFPTILKLSRERGIAAFSLAEDGRISIASLENVCPSVEMEKAREWLEDEGVAKVGVDIKASMAVLRKAGIGIAGMLWDLELMHYLLNPETSHKVDFIAPGYLHRDEQSCSFGVVELFEPLREAIMKEWNSDTEKLYREMEEPLIRVLSAMEAEGFRVDTAMLADYGRQLNERMMEIEDRVREMGGEPGLNISSPKQVGELLFGKLALDPKIKRNPRGQFPTDEETLLSVASLHPIVDKILSFRALKKMLSTYIEPLPGLIDPKDGRIHTTFHQALTATGRLSSSKPNLQNIPIRTELGREIRRAFVPSGEGRVIVSADYSQIELRLMASMCSDPDMIAAFRAGEDVHRSTAAKIYKLKPEEVSKEQRSTAKTANFGIIYGISAFGLSQRLRIPMKEAKWLIDQYFEHYPLIKKYIDGVLEQARKDGWVETMFHRRRYLPMINSSNKTVRSVAERNAINAPIQGSAADIIKIAMVRVDKALRSGGLKSRMILQVHDELVFDVPEEELEVLVALVKREMENVVSLPVPLTVEVDCGSNWLDAH
ncbi:MAG: DNA polymerase I [Bacteroidales bacterium]|nr:DNA polymerase I [Bacteroidales bacterium]